MNTPTPHQRPENRLPKWQRKALWKLTLRTLCAAVVVIITAALLEYWWPTPGSKTFAVTLGLVMVCGLITRYAYIQGIRDAAIHHGNP
jgi:uncharacterized membrane protein YccC